MYLARKVRLAKWEWRERPDVPPEQALQSAIESDLKALNNELSFWRCPTKDLHDVREVALAIAAAGDHLQRVQLALVNERDLASLGLEILPTPGRTPVTDLKSLHVSVPVLGNAQLRELALAIREAVSTGAHHTFAKPDIRALVDEAAIAGRVRISEVSEELRAKLDRPSL